MNRSIESNRRPTLVIGVGNIFRGDDAAGILAARRLNALNLPEVEILEHSGEGAGLMEALKDRDSVILVDTVQSGAVSGDIMRFEAHTESLPAHFSGCSTHAFGVAEAIEMARLLSELPRRLIVFGIEGKNFEPGSDLSPEVARAIQETTDKVCRDLKLGIVPIRPGRS
jgi:hydrogenase maturation protease